MNRNDFINKVNMIYGNYYDGSHFSFNNIRCKDKIEVICPKHGPFSIRVDSFLNRNDCPICKSLRNISQNGFKDTKESFIEKANNIHNNKYDYSKIEYVNNKTKICIICSEHGEYLQTPHNHLMGYGCPKCGIEKCVQSRLSNTNAFIEKSKVIHNNRYDYSKVEYINNRTKVCIICPKHGEFWLSPNKHLLGCGCQKCSGKFRYNTESFILKANEVHNKKYDYSKTKYVNNNTKVCIICPIHGEFWQNAHSHLCGHGCPMCNESKLEDYVAKTLEKHNIAFKRQQRFKWLGKLSLDFYLPDYNIAIECQGRQHFESIEYFGGDKYLEEIKIRDNIKKKKCEEHNIKLIYFGDKNYNDNIIITEEDLLKDIYI